MGKELYEIVDKKTKEQMELLSKSMPKYNISPFTTGLEELNKNTYLSGIQSSLGVSNGMTKAILGLSTTLSSVMQSNIPDMGKIISKSMENSAIRLATVAAETMGRMLGEMINSSIRINIPKIKFPVISEETRRMWKFMEITSEINFPIYFEVDTELQDKILDIYDGAVGEPYPAEEMKQCIFDYYDTDMLSVILNTWIQQEWIKEERKAALKEAIEVYDEGRYYSAGSILMCQLGGLITELYDYTHTNQLITLAEKKEVLSMYNIKRDDGEKAKIVQMMSMQQSGIYLWYNSAEYFMNFIYSSSKNMEKFEYDPGRNKICHGIQTNYGTKEHALKSILAVDIVIQLGMQMTEDIQQAS